MDLERLKKIANALANELAMKINNNKSGFSTLCVSSNGVACQGLASLVVTIDTIERKNEEERRRQILLAD